ncbi:MAG: hypothetical protein ACRENA_06775 [Vulcanimicrobiaceae bacterium]
MLKPVFLALAVAGAGASAPSPAPSPAPSTAAQPLQEIGHVFSSGACTAIVVRANSAISTTLRNDQTVSLSIDTLRHVNLDNSNTIQRHKDEMSIERLAENLRTSSGDAESQIKRLKEMAAQTTDPIRKEDLKEFADALGGALARQRKIGADLQRMLVIMDGRRARAEARADIAYTGSGRQTTPFDESFGPTHFNDIALSAAQELEGRTLSIAADETKAAEHVIGAVNGC